MKLWNKGYSVDNVVDRYTVGNDRELDIQLAKHDLAGTRAHVTMLHGIGIISSQELNEIIEGLDQIQNTIDQGRFTIEEEFEDVHSKIEFELVKRIGEAGKKTHTARSRNDQVLVDLHLYAKEQIVEIQQGIEVLFNTLISLSETHQQVLMPGYTHTQVAMPSSFGLWFSAYAESLIDDVILLNAAYEIADQNPLGSAAGYGSSFPIDRQKTTDLLGFSTMKYNVVAAQMSRGKLEKSVGYAIASLAGTLSKFSTDVCLYMSQNFNFISFPKELTTGSSIMPHKQNPDVFEVMRAKCNKLQNIPTEIAMITNNLTSGYHRDLQLLKESFMESIAVMKDNLEVCNFMLQHIQVNADILNNPMYEYLYSVEEVNKLVLEGETFRDAYQKVGKDILEGQYNPSTEVHHSHQGSLGNLCLDHIKEKFMKAKL